MKLVFIDNLKRGMITAADVYPPSSRTVPYVRKDTPLTNQMISEMRRLDIRFAYVQEAPRVQEEKRPAKPPPVIKPAPVISPKLRQEAVDVLENMFTSLQIGAEDIHASTQIVKQLDRVVDNLVQSIVNNSNVMVNINDLKSYDDYTYHHSLSVAVLSIAIGQYLNFDRKELNRIGMCAMMHDIGKTAVPIEIIHKPSKLDDQEFHTIQNHPPAGYDYLHRAEIGDEALWKGVLHHHEKIDGSGYPSRLKGEEIPLFSRIISVGDVYDALTSNRPYREPMQPAEAVEYIMGSIDTAFDYDIVSAFLKKVELYPVGSRVQLSNGMQATVLGNENLFRPVVRLDSGEMLDLYRDHKVFSIVVSKLLSG